MHMILRIPFPDGTLYKTVERSKKQQILSGAIFLLNQVSSRYKYKTRLWDVFTPKENNFSLVLMKSGRFRV